MQFDAWKIWVVASTEFGSTVRTKWFVIGLLLFPVIMGGAIVLQVVVADRVDTKPRRFVVVDHSQTLEPVLKRAVAEHNARLSDAAAKGARAPFVLEPTPAGVAEGTPAASSLGLELSEQIRRGELDAFVEIPAEILEPAAAGAPAGAIRYHSDNPNDDLLRDWLGKVVNDEVRSRRFLQAGLDQATADRLSQPVPLENLGLLERVADGTGPEGIKSAQKVDPIRSLMVPSVLMFVMYFVIMTSAPQLLNSVIEEKMSRISEVLLGSISPFELMMGKLLGNTGIAMVLAMLYVGGAYGVAAYHGYGDVVSPGLLAALALFVFLAILLYGSLYTAVGAACSELKDAQSLMMPVMILSMLPLVVWTAVLRNPSSSLSVGVSLFPPASPMLMFMRLALKPAPPSWQVVLSVLLTTATAVACVWAAGKIFRTGLLMQGKAPSFAELARWVMAR